MIVRRDVQPLAKKLGITKTIGWHTFRRAFASVQNANGENVKVVEELCRHANPNTTMTLYAQALTEDARRAQNKIVVMVRSCGHSGERRASANWESGYYALTYMHSIAGKED